MHPLVPERHFDAALARPVPAATRPGFGAGVAAVFQGFGFLARTPAVWPLALVPVVAAVTLTMLLGWLAVTTIPGWVEHAMGASSGAAWSFLTMLAQLVATLLAGLVAVLVAFGLAQPLSGPALERIVRRAEADAGGAPWPKTSVFADIVRSIQSVGIAYAVGIPLLALLFAIGFFFAPAAVVTVPLKLLVTAMMVAWDLFDYPLSIRGRPIKARVALVARNLPAVFGFGCSVALLSMATCGILTLPAGVAGAARLVLAIERWEQAPGSGLRASGTSRSP